MWSFGTVEIRPGLSYPCLSELFRKIVYRAQNTDSPKTDGHSEYGILHVLWVAGPAGHEWFIGG
jgi:hypothetical protein